MDCGQNTIKEQDKVLIYPKKQVKSDVSRSVISALLNLMIMNTVMVIYVIIKMLLVYILTALKEPDMKKGLALADAALQDETFLNSLVESGTPYLISIVLGILLVWLIMRSKVPAKKVFASNNPMTVEAFVMCLVVFMGVQFPISVLDSIVEAGLNAIGLTGQLGMEMATAGSTTVTMFLYVSIGAPLAEELVYRGFVMKSLEKYGKTFAILMSSVLFGLMHTNFIQSIFAMIVGVILGYVAMHYSLKWSILLHALNNCLFGEVLVWLLKGESEEIANMVDFILFVGFFIAALAILIVKKTQIRRYVQKNWGPKEHYSFAFSSVWLWIFIVGASLGGLMVIQKL